MVMVMMMVFAWSGGMDELWLWLWLEEGLQEEEMVLVVGVCVPVYRYA
jgi:hypothetical protein